MDKTHSIINSTERKRGQHLGVEERGAIQHLKELGYSNRFIVREIHCSPTAVGNELRRETLNTVVEDARRGYSAKRGATVYKTNRQQCRRPEPVAGNSSFVR